MKNKVLLPLAFIMAFTIAVGVSAFKKPEKVKAKTTSGYFYKYKLSVYDATNLQTIGNYERSNDACSPGSHVCGVFLPSDATLGDPPNSGEFSNVVSTILDSEAAGSAQSGDISMRN